MPIALLRFLLLAVLALSSGCGGAVLESETDGGATGIDGGLTGIDGGLGSDGANPRDSGPDSATLADGAAGNGCTTASGMRICGGVCPALTASECPGRGCVNVLDRVTHERSTVGICLPDIPTPQRSCGSCLDGQVCAHIDGQGIVCVAEDVCLALFKRGVTKACRYADFTPYDGRPLSVATGAQCPKRACGPGCGSCQGPLCTGRSADYGYGTCVEFPAVGDCSARSPLPINHCDSCLVWKPAPGDDPVSLDYGTCITSGSGWCPSAEVRMTCLP